MTANSDPMATTAADWFWLPLGDAMLAGPRLAELRQAFQQFRMNAGAATALTLLLRTDAAGQLHCQQHLYFSPACAPLALRYGAKPCPQPLLAGLEWFAGDAGNGEQAQRDCD